MNIFYCELAQLVEQLTVNQFVIGSNPIFAVNLINYPFAVARLVPPPKFAENGLFTAHEVESVPFGNLLS